MWRNDDTNEEEVDLKLAIAEIRENSTIRTYASANRLNPSYISQVCNDNRPPSDKLLDKLGLERRIIYVRKKRRWR